MLCNTPQLNMKPEITQMNAEIPTSRTREQGDLLKRRIEINKILTEESKLAF